MKQYSQNGTTEFLNISRSWSSHLKNGHIEAYLGGQLWKLLQTIPALGMPSPWADTTRGSWVIRAMFTERYRTEY